MNFYASIQWGHLTFKFDYSLGIDLRIRDLNVQIEALNDVLDQLDSQIEANIDEITKIRIPEAIWAVERNR